MLNRARAVWAVENLLCPWCFWSCCWSHTFPGHVFLLFEVFGNLRFRKQAEHPEDAFWCLDWLPESMGSLQGSAWDKKVFPAYFHVFTVAQRKSGVCVWIQAGWKEKVVFEDLWEEFWRMDFNGRQHFTHNEYNFTLNNEPVDLK